MKKLILCAAVIVLAGCSSNPLKLNESQKSFDQYKTAEFDYPEWYLNPPSEDGAIFATASEISSDLQFSIDKSTLSAQRDIAFKLNNDVNQKFKEYTSETNFSKNEQVSKMHERTTIANSEGVNLVGVQRVKVKVIREGERYRSFVLVRYGLDESNKIHMNYMVKERRANAQKELDKYDQQLRDDKKSQSKQPEIIGLTVEDPKVRERVAHTLQQPDAVVIKGTVQ